MTEPHEFSSWDSTESNFNFQLQKPKRIQRGWERAPKSPHAARLRGRKVWKRAEIRVTAPREDLANPTVDDGRIALSETSTNTPRPVKKLRLKDKPGNQAEVAETKHVRYLTTVRDAIQGTPRRKQPHPQGSLYPTGRLEYVRDLGTHGAALKDKSKAAESAPAEDSQEPMEYAGSEPEELVTSVMAQPLADPKDLEESRRATSMEREEVGHEDQSRTEPSPLGEATGPPMVEVDRVGELSERHQKALDQGLLSPNTGIAGTESTSSSKGYTDISSPFTASQSKKLLKKVEYTDMNVPFSASLRSSTTSNANNSTPTQAQYLVTQTSATPLARRATVELTSEADLAPKPSDLSDIDSPQIGTTLLRRESLRQRESPRTKAVRKGRSSQKRQLKKRDTLQEREILQRFSEVASPCPKTKSHEVAYPASPRLLKEVTQKSEEERSTIINSEPAAEIGVRSCIEDREAIADTKTSPTAADTIEASEGIAGLTQPLPSRIDMAEISLPAHGVRRQSKSNPRAEIAAADQMEDMPEKADQSIGKIRLCGRFSDDTSVLKDFLNRAQARKAAKDTLEVPKSLQESPRRSPRKTPQPRHGITTPSQKLKELTPRNIAARPNTQPDKSKNNHTYVNGVEEPATEPTSCRRSARNRAAGPPKTASGGPSLIPVRRADGTEPVVLQKSEAQEVALVTRANTRRNKGQSKPPLLALHDLPVETFEVMTIAKQRAADAKAVAWAEELASYYETNNGKKEEGDQRRQIRRMRGLGAAKGTPVARKTRAVAPPSNGTPAPKRRGKNHLFQ